MALNLLMEGFDVHRKMPGNTVVLANTWLEIFAGHTALPYGAEWVDVTRNPDCLVCGSARAAGEEAVSLDDLINLGHASYEQDEGGR